MSRALWAVTLLALVIGPLLSSRADDRTDAAIERLAPGQSILLPPPTGIDFDILGQGFDQHLRANDSLGRSYRVYPPQYKIINTNEFQTDIDIIDSTTKRSAYAGLHFLGGGLSQIDSKRYVVIYTRRTKQVATLIENTPAQLNSPFYAKRLHLGYAIYHVIEGDARTFSESAALSFKRLGAKAERIISDYQLKVHRRYIGLDPTEEIDSNKVITDESTLNQHFRPGEKLVPIAVEYAAQQRIDLEPIRWQSSKLTAGMYRISNLSIQVSRRKVNGNEWDFDGKQNEPDPIADIYVDNEMVGICSEMDTFKFECSPNALFQLKKGSAISVRVRDKDRWSDDPIGNVTVENVLDAGSAQEEIDLPTGSPQLEKVTIRLARVTELPGKSTANASSRRLQGEEDASPPKPVLPVLQEPEIQLLRSPPQVVQMDTPMSAQVEDALPPIDYPSGLRVQKLALGRGRLARPGQQVLIHYSVRSASTGRMVESTFGSNRPLAFQLGTEQVMRGLDDGVTDMTQGERRRLFVPASLGYGTGRNSSPPYAVGENLIIEVVLLRILSPSMGLP